MQCTIRMGNRNSSVKVRDELLALWYILNFPDKEISYREVQNEVRRFVSKCLVGYKPKSPYYVGSKSITEFVNSCIIQDVLERPERIRYRRCLKMLNESLFKGIKLGEGESNSGAGIEGIAERDLVLSGS